MDSKSRVLVWDGVVRVGHWLIVVLVVGAYLTGDEKGWLHRYLGYAIFLLTVMRLLWGFCGSAYARFDSFAYTPARAVGYLRSLAAGRPQHYLGHNPAAAWMIYALLGCLAFTCISGYGAHLAKISGVAMNPGVPISFSRPAFADDRSAGRYREHGDGKRGHGKSEVRHQDERESVWDDVHETSANVLLGLATLHLVGVAASSLAHRENLVASMITGYKEPRSPEV